MAKNKKAKKPVDTQKDKERKELLGCSHTFTCAECGGANECDKKVDKLNR